MKNHFPKRNKWQSKLGVCNVNAKFRDGVLKKSSLSICIYIYIYIHTYIKSFFSKIQSVNLSLALQAHFFWNGAYRDLEKSSSCINITSCPRYSRPHQNCIHQQVTSCLSCLFTMLWSRSTALCFILTTFLHHMACCIHHWCLVIKPYLFIYYLAPCQWKCHLSILVSLVS